MSREFGNPSSLEATAKKVTVSTIPVLASMPQEHERPDFQVLVRVQAPTDAALRRAPIDLVAVLEVSQSMRLSPETTSVPRDGEPSRLDLLKVAMNLVVDNLRAGDRLATVAFDHNVVPEYSSSMDFSFTEISDSDGGDKERKALKASVDAMQPRGMWTLFGPGLDKALEILENRSSADKEKRVGSVIFLSDGGEDMPVESYWRNRIRNLSEKYPSPYDWKRNFDMREAYVELRRRIKAQAVHTFGFTKFHDPAELSAIAEASGGGTFSFLQEGQLDRITDAFELCLRGLQTVVAADVTVDLTCGVGVRITGIDSGGYTSSVAADGGSGRIAMPVLYAGEAKDFVVHLNVPRHASGTGSQMLLTTHGQWRRTTHTAVEIIEQGDLILKRPAAHAGGEKEPARPKEKDDDGRVMEQVLRYKVLELMEHVLESTDLSKEERATAMAAATMGLAWALFRGSTASMWAALPDVVVRRYDEHVVEMQRSLRSGDGGAYVAAWRSSNLMQRVTTMGSPEKVVAEFKTEAIEKMGEVGAKEQVGTVAEAEAAAELPVDEQHQVLVVPVPPMTMENEGRPPGPAAELPIDEQQQFAVVPAPPMTMENEGRPPGSAMELPIDEQQHAVLVPAPLAQMEDEGRPLQPLPVDEQPLFIVVPEPPEPLEDEGRPSAPAAELPIDEQQQVLVVLTPAAVMEDEERPPAPAAEQPPVPKEEEGRPPTSAVELLVDKQQQVVVVTAPPTPVEDEGQPPTPAAELPVDELQQVAINMVPVPLPAPEDEERQPAAAAAVPGTASELVGIASPAPEEKEARLWPCACPEYDMIGKQLGYWCVVKRDLLRLVRQVEGDGGHHILTGTFHDLSLASINRAMHESVFLAVEHAHNIRSCYRAATGQHAVAAAYDGEER